MRAEQMNPQQIAAEPKISLQPTKATIHVLALRGGGGHYATYKALEAVIEQQQLPWNLELTFADNIGANAVGVEVDTEGDRLAEPLTSQPSIARLFSRTSGYIADKVYDLILQKGWNWIHLFTLPLHKQIIKLRSTVDRQLLSEKWQVHPADLILSVVPFHNRRLWESLPEHWPSQPIPIVTLLTDFGDTPPAYWIEPDTDNYLICGTAIASQQALAQGVRPDRILPTSGLVINPSFYQPAQPQAWVHQEREKLGLDADRPTALVLFGANGSLAMLDIAEQLEDLGDRLQIIFICGRNLAVEQALVQQETAQKRVVVGFTQAVAQYMAIADFFIGKPGNVSISEALKMGLPVIVNRNWLTMPQERHVADWIKAQQVGLTVQNFKQIRTAVEQMLQPGALACYQSNVQQFDNQAVFEVVEILQAILQRPVSPHRLAKHQLSKIDVLEQQIETNKPTRALSSAVSLYQFTPQAILHPTTEADLVQAVQLAAKKGLNIRAIGSLHSAVPIPATDGICIVLDRYQKLLKVEGTQVTVQAGIQLCQLSAVLAKQGLALPTLGTIDQQTIAGAISTGTHGGSLHRPSLSGYVCAVSLIKSDGTLVAVTRDQPEFQAVGLSLGLLGILSTVTIDCVPAFSLRAQTHAFSFKQLIENFERVHQDNDFVDIRYSPITNIAHAVLINRPDQLIRENGGWEPVRQSKMAWRVTEVVNKKAQRLFQQLPINGLQRWCLNRYEQSVYSAPYGRSDFVLTHFDATSDDLISNKAAVDLDPVADMELAVPYQQAIAALQTLKDHFHKTQRYPTMQIHIRCSAGENFWLSPTQGDPICWLEFWEYPCTGEFFKEMVTLLKPFGLRGHWGKQIPIESAYLQAQYPHWQSFCRLVEQWDADGRFSNSTLNQYFRAEG